MRWMFGICALTCARDLRKNPRFRRSPGMVVTVPCCRRRNRSRTEMSQLPKIVRDRLAGAPAAAVQNHPDPDLLTVFVEGSVGAREREQIVSHLAGCSECRDVVALA